MDGSVTGIMNTEPKWDRIVAASRKEAGSVYTRYVNRNLAIPFTYVFWRLGLTPNWVSALSFVVTHFGLLVVALGPLSVKVMLVGYVFLVLGFALDSSDGQLARVRGLGSKAGEWVDHTLDMAKILTFNLAIGYVMTREYGPGTGLASLSMFAFALNILTHPMLFVGGLLWEKLSEKRTERVASEYTHREESRGSSGFMKWARLFVQGSDYGFRIMMVLLLPWMETFVRVYALYGVYMWVIVAGSFIETFRRFRV